MKFKMVNAMNTPSARRARGGGPIEDIIKFLDKYPYGQVIVGTCTLSMLLGYISHDYVRHFTSHPYLADYRVTTIVKGFRQNCWGSKRTIRAFKKKLDKAHGNLISQVG